MFRIRMIRSAAGVCAVGALMCLTASDAQAQHCGYGHGGYGGRGISVSFGSGYGGYGAFGYGGYGRGLSFSAYRPIYRRAPVWHDTSHLDYFPTRVVPHGNHLDVIPGHYRVHRTGHWDHH